MCGLCAFGLLLCRCGLVWVRVCASILDFGLGAPALAWGPPAAASPVVWVWVKVVRAFRSVKEAGK